MELTSGQKAARTRRLRAAGRKAAATRRRRAAGRKAAKTRIQRVAARKAAATRKRRAARTAAIMPQWESYEQVGTYLLDQFAAQFGLHRVEAKQEVPGQRSGTSWEI